MSIQNVLDFCNQYIMMKILVQHQLCLQKSDKSKPSVKQIKKNKVKGMKFQNPTKRPKVQQHLDDVQQQQPQQQQIKTQKIKKKKPKLEGGTKKKQLVISPDIRNNVQKQKQQQGYVPIENLLTQFSTKIQQRPKYQNVLASFGTSQINLSPNPSKISNPYIQNFNTRADYNYLPTSFNQIPSLDRYDDSWKYRHTRNQYNSMSQPVIQTLNHQYDSPIKRMFHQMPTYQVPISRGYNQFDRSNSRSKLSQNSVSKKSLNQKFSKKNKKKGQRSFYLPVSNNSSKQNLEVSQCTSTNNIMDRIQRQINEQSYIGMKNEDHSKMQTGFQTKYDKKQASFKKDYDQYSQIQLDGVRQSLSFLSEARGPPKPIPVHLKK